MNRIGVFVLTMVFLAGGEESGWGEAVINELHYNPAEDTPTEFVELFNPTSQAVALGGYSFTSGIYFTFPMDAVIQPGGSERDFESIEACNEANAAMVFTGQRCFKH